jgi:hypothetical protein
MFARMGLLSLLLLCFSACTSLSSASPSHSLGQKPFLGAAGITPEYLVSCQSTRISSAKGYLLTCHVTAYPHVTTFTMSFLPFTQMPPAPAPFVGCRQVPVVQGKGTCRQAWPGHTMSQQVLVTTTFDPPWENREQLVTLPPLTP